MDGIRLKRYRIFFLVISAPFLKHDLPLSTRFPYMNPKKHFRSPNILLNMFGEKTRTESVLAFSMNHGIESQEELSLVRPRTENPIPGPLSESHCSGKGNSARRPAQ